MEKPTDKRARLRVELQEAYGEWLRLSTPLLDAPEGSPIDLNGGSSPASRQWLAYLAAKKRLIEAYAERPAAA